MAKKIICAFGTDIDSVAGWIGGLPPEKWSSLK